MPRKRQKPGLRYFYVNGDLHKVIRLVRAEDLVEAWNYREGRSTAYVLSNVRKTMESAFSLQEVGSMVGRHRVQLERYIINGEIKTPQRAYSMNGGKIPGKYLFSETDVIALHEYMLTIHKGRPRKDGKITPGRMPTRAELRATMKHDLVTYIKTGDNEFRPIWKEVEW